MAGWWVKRLEEIPRIGTEEPGEPEWYPLQHHFGLTAFGANVYVAREAGDELLGEHDELHSDQEELYIVVSGEARFELAGESRDVPAVGVVYVRDPAVKRKALATSARTTLIALGGAPREDFSSSWRASWFEGVGKAEGA